MASPNLKAEYERLYPERSVRSEPYDPALHMHDYPYGRKWRFWLSHAIFVAFWLSYTVLVGSAIVSLILIGG